MQRTSSFPRAALALATVVIAAAPFHPTPCAAQESPLRARRTAATFAVANGFYGIGLLRFTSPSQAWLVEGDAYVNRLSETRSSSSPGSSPTSPIPAR
jgi:hypothetical protein